MSRHEAGTAPVPLVFRVRPERTQPWLKAVHALIDTMSREDSVLSRDLQRDAHDANLLTLHERWA